MGRKNSSKGDFLSPHAGLGWLDDQTHGFTVGYYLPHLRRWVAGAAATKTRRLPTLVARGLQKIFDERLHNSNSLVVQ